MVYPDVLLHADVNGVTTIPKEIASEVAEVGDAFVAAEAVILETLRQYGPDLRPENGLISIKPSIII